MLTDYWMDFLIRFEVLNWNHLISVTKYFCFKNIYGEGLQ